MCGQLAAKPPNTIVRATQKVCSEQPVFFPGEAEARPELGSTVESESRVCHGVGGVCGGAEARPGTAGNSAPLRTGKWLALCAAGCGAGGGEEATALC